VTRALYTKLSFNAERDLAAVSQTVSIRTAFFTHAARFDGKL
jgi:hypothetical protein